MKWIFWREAHETVLVQLKAALMPHRSRKYAGAIALIGASLAGVLLLGQYHVPGLLYIDLTLILALVMLAPALYVYAMIAHVPVVVHNYREQLSILNSRLFAKNVEESCLVSLHEYALELKLLECESVRTDVQFANWTERYQNTIQAIYIIISKGISNNCALSFVAYPVSETRYIRGSFNDEHAVWRFNLQKYTEKLTGIIDGYYLTIQHARPPRESTKAPGDLQFQLAA